MVASAGIGAVLGFSIEPLPLIVFAILVAIYDLLAVKWTGHMVEFAKHFMKQKTAFSVGFEGVRRKRVMERGKPVVREEPWMIELGSGDMAIASAITVVSYKLGGFLFPLAAMAGSAIGLYLVMERAAKERAVMPAMPMIVSFSLILVAAALVFASVLKF
ncbi:Signal-peptide peptidase, presenilin aspartyl protease [uncultured archaeon]|nr:Signal-peptide peptidase, presenilin aspartyl protease [uncultured archaeon]